MGKKTRSVRVQVLALCLAVAAGTAGCATTNRNNGKEPGMPTYAASETFRIGNFGVPPHENTGYKEYANNPNYCTLDNWTVFRDCGFNIAFPTAGVSRAEVIRDLEMADEVGMKVLVRDQTSAGFETIIRYAHDKGYGYDETRAVLDQRAADIKANIDEYAKHPSFCGVNAYDEPSMDYYEAIAACQDWFLTNYPDYEFYANLLPVYATPKGLYGSNDGKGYSYPDYVSEFVKEVNPMSLSYDHYPILRDYDESAYIKEDFLYNLNVFAKQAQKKRIPVYIYLQTIGFYNNLPISTYEEFAWQCYTSMAFGVRGIMTFSYWTGLEAEYHNNVRDGIVERDGTVRPLYYEVQKVFNEIKAMQDVYMHFTWNGVKTIEGGRIMNDMFALVTDQLESFARIDGVETDRDIIVGQFEGEKDEYAYMVTNASEPFDPVSAAVTVTFDSDVDYVMVVKKTEREVVKLDKHQLDINIGSGEGYFLVPLQ